MHLHLGHSRARQCSRLPCLFLAPSLLTCSLFLRFFWSCSADRHSLCKLMGMLPVVHPWTLVLGSGLRGCRFSYTWHRPPQGEAGKPPRGPFPYSHHISPSASPEGTWDRCLHVTVEESKPCKGLTPRVTQGFALHSQRVVLWSGHGCFALEMGSWSGAVISRISGDGRAHQHLLHYAKEPANHIQSLRWS